MRNLDDIDIEMIELLRADARLSIPALARRIGIGRATAYNRFDRLVEEGAIERFTAVVTPAALGLHVAALVQINIDQKRWRKARDQLRRLPGVEWIGLTSGPFDIQMLIRCQDLGQLRDAVLERLHQIPEVISAQTFVLLDEPAPIRQGDQDAAGTPDF